MKKILIDCSFIRTTKLNTGIQRVVRKVVENIDKVTDNSDFKPLQVALDEGDIKEVSILNNCSITSANNIEINPGDILLLLDSTWHLDTWQNIQKAKAKGAIIVSVIYDIIPITHPYFCDENLVRLFNQWFSIAIDQVDAFISISKTVQQDLYSYLKENYPKQINDKLFDHFLLGADFNYDSFSHLSKGVRDSLREVYNDKKDSIYLIVCTLEPRKNHTYLLDVFDMLWSKGVDISLNIVGKEGWMVDDLIQRIKHHKKLNTQLFYWNDLNDEELNYCYQNSKMMLFPSFVEGFGLPIIESLNNKLPVLASDIPIHREVGGDKIGYFDINDTNDLVNKILSIEKFGIPKELQVEESYRWLNWRESTEILFDKIQKIADSYELEDIINRVKNIKQQSDISDPKASDQRDTPKQNPAVDTIKSKIKSIPLLGWFIRWTYNLIRLNNIKHQLFIDTNQIEALKVQISQLNHHFIQEQNSIKLSQNTLNQRQDSLEQRQDTLNQRQNTLEQSQNTLDQRQDSLEDTLEEKADIEDTIKLYKQLSQQKDDLLGWANEIEKIIQNIKQNLPPKTIQEQLQKISSTQTRFEAIYQDFEDKFRGKKDDIKEYLKIYLPFIEKISSKKEDISILDIGCGRGEWLELVKEQGYKAKGIDTNYQMIQECQKTSLDVELAEALNYLRNLPSNSFSMITAFHVIEHLPSFDTVLILLEQCYRVLKPNGMIIFETPNPRNILVGSSDFYLDPSHKNPLHPLSMKFFTKRIGFCNVSSLIIDSSKLEDIEYMDFNSIDDYIYIGRNYAITGSKS